MLGSLLDNILFITETARFDGHGIVDQLTVKPSPSSSNYTGKLKETRRRLLLLTAQVERLMVKSEEGKNKTSTLKAATKAYLDLLRSLEE